MTEYTIKLTGLNPMKIECFTAINRDGVIQFIEQPDENGDAVIVFAISASRFEYFGPTKNFEVVASKGRQ